MEKRGIVVANVTIIIIDNKLLQFLDKCRKELDMNVFYIDRRQDFSEQIYELKKYRQMVKNAVKNNELTLMNNKTKIGMPDYFAMCVALINDNDIVMKGWENIFKLGEIEICEDLGLVMGQLEVEGDITDKTTYKAKILNIEVGSGTCCCGHHITQFYELKLRYMERKIITGCCCIEKNLITNDRLKVIFRKSLNNTKRIMSNYRKCIDCNEYNIKIEKYTEIKNGIEIVKDNKWKKRCFNCHLINKNKFRGRCFLKAPKK